MDWASFPDAPTMQTFIPCVPRHLPVRCRVEPGNRDAVRGRDHESLNRVVAGVSPNARAEIGRGAGRADDGEYAPVR
jgi:hypothetical protein